jgi:hypothetical protein
MWLGADRDPFPWLLRSLENMVSSSNPHACLESLTFGVTTEEFSDANLKLILEHQVWDILDEILTGKAFPNIHKVTIFVSNIFPLVNRAVQWVKPMTERLPRVEAKGVLVVTRFPYYQDWRTRGFSTIT